MSQQKEKIEPVYFMDLVVENVRCFKNKQVMDLSDGNGKPARWTIILGDNGTGKTTLLKCLAFLQPDKKFKTLDDELQPIPSGFYEYSPFNESYLSNQNSNFYISSNSLYQGKISNKEIGKYIEEYGFGTGIAHRLGAWSSGELSFENIFIIAYGANRQSSQGSLVESSKRGQLANLFDTEAKLINAEAWLLETDFAIKSSEGSIKKYLQNHYFKVQGILKKLLPDIQDFRVKAITKTKIQAAIEVKTPYGWVDMKNLSLGYQTFIAWVVDLAARLFDYYPDSDAPLEEPCIVLVDEIDLHLHPKWQRKIVSFLTDIFKNAQFIVTAHSPLIVQAAEDANIILLKREGDSVRIHNNMDEEVIRGWRIDQVLTSDLFGLESARPPEYDSYLERQNEILEKAELTEEDEDELETIAKKVEELSLPNKSANEAIEALRKATAILKS